MVFYNELNKKSVFQRNASCFFIMCVLIFISCFINKMLFFYEKMNFYLKYTYKLKLSRLDKNLMN